MAALLAIWTTRLALLARRSGRVTWFYLQFLMVAVGCPMSPTNGWV